MARASNRVSCVGTPDRGRVHNSGQGLHRLDHLVTELRIAAPRVARLRERDRHREQIVLIEARRRIEDAQQALLQQGGSNQQHDGDRDGTGRQHVDSPAAVAAASGGPRCGLQHFAGVSRRRESCRHDADEQAAPNFAMKEPPGFPAALLAKSVAMPRLDGIALCNPPRRVTRPPQFRKSVCGPRAGCYLSASGTGDSIGASEAPSENSSIGTSFL